MNYKIEIKLKNSDSIIIHDESIEDIEEYSKNFQEIFLTQYIISLESIHNGVRRITQIRTSEIISTSIYQEKLKLENVVTMDE